MSARQAHKQSLIMREKGEFLESLKLSVSALLEYQQEDDQLGFTEAIADQTITLRLLSQETNFKEYLILAKHLLEASIEIANLSNNSEALPIPLFNLGKVNVELQDYPEAIRAYKMAIEQQSTNPSPHHNRPSILADFRIHLAVAEYKNGDKKAKNRLLEALNELQNLDEEDYNKKVWTSGANMYLADMLRTDSKDEAKVYLNAAKEIIDSDERLILRKEQWQKLAKLFSS